MGTTTDVVITEDIGGEPFDSLTKHWSVITRPGAWQDPRELAELASSAKALVVRNRTQVTRELLQGARHLMIVARAGVGLDNIDVTAADDCGVVVTAPLGANAISVAEHTVGLALGLARKTTELHAACRHGEWRRTPGIELSGGTWGLLGAGATARACGRIAASLGMTVLAYDPFIDEHHPELISAGIRLASLEDVVSQADVLSCHLPSTHETRALVDKELIALMRPRAFLVNVGRGEVIDEDALADALDRGRLGGAGLDVRSSEPPALGRLERLDNVILTPHVAGITIQSQHRILQVLGTDIDAVLSGNPAASAVGAVREASS